MGIRKKLASTIFNKWGWSAEGPIPYDVPKCVVVVYPHTSNWDFPVGILFNTMFDIEINFVAKDSLFKPPIGGLMRKLGGKPVIRSRSTKFVDAIARIYKESDVFRLCITPEGTRSKPEVLKSGFHHIARAANVPVVFCAFHWDTKTMRWGEPFYVTDNYEDSVRAFHEFFRGTEAHTPKNAYIIPDED